MRGSSCSFFCKFRSSVSGDFEHVFSRFHFSPVTDQRKSHTPLRGSLVHVCAAKFVISSFRRKSQISRQWLKLDSTMALNINMACGLEI